MDTTYDANKNAKNIIERELSFELVKTLGRQNVIYKEGTRKDYGGQRFRIFGSIGGIM